MSSLATQIPSMAPLTGKLPISAPDYYAITTADLNRIPSDIYCIKDALITVDYSLPYQFTFSIAESDGSWFTKVDQFHEIKPHENPVYIDENVGFLEDRFSKFNICHFLFDKLGRTVEFDNLPVDSYFMFTGHDYFSEVFSMMGLRQTPLIERTENIVTYRVKALYLSSSTFKFRHPAFNFRPEVVQMLCQLKKLCLDTKPVELPTPRIYVDRKSVSARDIVNKDVLEPILNDFDFTSISFEDYSLKEQASIVHGADVMLGVHGAGLANALFFNNDSFQLLEIFPPLCASSDYWKLASAFEFQYDAYIALDTELSRPDYANWNHDPTLNRRDILIEEDEFRLFLDRNIGK